ncbi:MAG: helix-turn-helix domain-containing protein [Myxococcales bacterium]
MKSTTPTWVEETIAPLPPVATIKETATALRCSRRSIDRLVASGRLHSVRQEGRRLIPRSAVAEYLRSLESAA